MWGQIDSQFIGFAWKRISRHEIDPRACKGHEFQGINALVALLGDQDRKKPPIKTDYYFFNDDADGNPSVDLVITSTSSWYDSRRRDASRRPEWRLYYASDEVQQKCVVGDLLIVGLRKDGSLAVMLIPQLTSSEVALKNVLGIGRLPKNGRGKTRWVESVHGDVGINSAETMELIQFSFSNVAPPGTRPPLPFPCFDFAMDTTVQKLTLEMLQKWPEKLGSCNEVINMLIRHSSFTADCTEEEPDRVFQYWLELAEASYREWENQILGNFLESHRWNKAVDDIEFGDLVSTKWMAFRQSRACRAGEVMEALLDNIFKRWSLRYDWKPKLPHPDQSKPQEPDFVFPGKSEYLDEDFPVERLRLLGAKTSLKERWRQILKEGDRVPKKHVATRDTRITDATFKKMDEAQLTLVMPQQVLAEYAYAPENLISLQTFLREVRKTQKPGK